MKGIMKTLVIIPQSEKVAELYSKQVNYDGDSGIDIYMPRNEYLNINEHTTINQ